MQLTNISRQQAENFPYIVDNRDWLISVFSSYGTKPIISAPFGKVFYFQFDDVLHNEKFAITKQQAKNIALIILHAESSNVSRLWIHCDAGVSRSGAIALAAASRGHYLDDEISNPRIPNELVLELVTLELLQS